MAYRSASDLDSMVSNSARGYQLVSELFVPPPRSSNAKPLFLEEERFHHFRQQIGSEFRISSDQVHQDPISYSAAPPSRERGDASPMEVEVNPYAFTSQTFNQFSGEIGRGCNSSQRSFRHRVIDEIEMRQQTIFQDMDQQHSREQHMNFRYEVSSYKKANPRKQNTQQLLDPYFLSSQSQVDPHVFRQVEFDPIFQQHFPTPVSPFPYVTGQHIHQLPHQQPIHHPIHQTNQQPSFPQDPYSTQRQPERENNLPSFEYQGHYPSRNNPSIPQLFETCSQISRMCNGKKNSRSASPQEQAADQEPHLMYQEEEDEGYDSQDDLEGEVIVEDEGTKNEEEYRCTDYEEDDEWKQDEVANEDEDSWSRHEDEDLETEIDSRNCEYEINFEVIQEEEDVEWEQGEEDEEYQCTNYEEEYPPLIPNSSAKYSSRNCEDDISFEVLQEEEIDEWEQGEVFVEDKSASDCDEDDDLEAEVDDLEAEVDNLEWSDIAESELGPVSEVKEGGGQEGVAKSVGNMNTISEPTLVGKDTTERARIDNFMVQELEGTQNEWGWCKQKLGDNTILAVLLTVCKSGNKLAMQEFMIFPVEASSFKEAIRMGVEVVKRSELQSLIRPPPEPPPKPPWPQLPHTLFKPQPQDEEEDSGYGATHFCSRTISGRDRFQGRWS